MNRSRTTHAGVFALFAAVSVAWTWPLATQLAARVAFDPGDPFLNAWILWWNAQALPFTERWWNPPIFHPMTGALALSEHLAGVGVLTTPLLLAGATPALAYNVALLLSCTLSGFFTYLLVRYLTGSTGAALCAGMAYALAPFRAGQLSHLQVLASQWLPLMLLGLHRYLDSGRRRWLGLFGIAWVLQALSNGYYLLFVPTLVAAWVVWFTVARRRWREAIEIVAASVLFSIPLIPVLLKYLEVHRGLGLFRPLGEILLFSGTLTSFLKPAPMLTFWPENSIPGVEDFLFPGLTIVLVVLATLPWAIRKRGSFGFYVFATVLMAAFTLGPARPDEGPIGWLRPYQWLIDLPGFDGVRVPVRFGMLMAFALSAAGGLGLAAALPRSRRWQTALSVCVVAGIAVDGAIEPLTGSAPPGRVELPRGPAAAVLELPPDDAAVSVGAMFRSISHGLPLINGYSGHFPPHYDILCQSLRRGDPSAVIELARGRTLMLLVSERHDPAGTFRGLVESIPGVQRDVITGAGASYILPAQPQDRRPRGVTSHAFASTLLPREHAVLDLESVRTIRTLEFPLRSRYPEFGRRFAIEVSNDGAAWTLAWEGWTGGAAVSGALENQVLIPVRFALPDISTRYVRIHPAPDWLVRELRVLGP